MSETETPDIAPEKIVGEDLLKFLVNVESGALVEQLEHDLKALVAELADRSRVSGGKPSGTLTMALKLVLDGGIFEVTAVTAVKMPKPIRGRTIFYKGLDNALTPNNPRQLAFDGIVQDPKDVISRAAKNLRTVR